MSKFSYKLVYRIGTVIGKFNSLARDFKEGFNLIFNIFRK